MNVFISNPMLIAGELELIAVCRVTRVYIIVLFYMCRKVLQSGSVEGLMKNLLL